MDDVIQTNLFFQNYRSAQLGKIDIICDMTRLNGYLDKEFLLKGAKQSRETEDLIQSVTIFGLKTIFHYMYKI